MTSTCVPVAQAEVIRLVKLDSCGVPVTGASSLQVVTNGLVQIGVSPQYIDGDVHSQKNAVGDLCNYYRDPDVFTDDLLTVQLCTVDPQLMAMALSARELTTGAPATGVGFARKAGASTTRYSIETWQRVTGAAACTPGGLQQYAYWAWPNVGQGRLNDLTIQNDPLNLEFQARTKAPSLLWGDGPGSVSWLPASVLVAADEHSLFAITTTPPPTPFCGTTTVT